MVQNQADPSSVTIENTLNLCRDARTQSKKMRAEKMLSS